ncbi:P-loop containing nucleoside triphosphate hydrolase protein, partial [Mycena albidolilacea]
LPSKPKIFHGRDSELDNLVKILSQKSARIAILGAGGMGKTSLARAALHHEDVASKYEYCFFVPCDSATTSIEIAALIGTNIGLKLGENLTQSVLHYFAGQRTSLLVLDNLEIPWEPLKSRRGVEELLSWLTEIPHLAVMITMRGAERPASVCWTKPFLPPLQPLSDDAARQTFFDIAGEFHESKHLDQVLRLTDNMPLAVDLIAHLVDNEGCSSVLARWEREKTSLLSVGHGRRSNLDASIAISLSSPRLTSSPGAMDLLRLLSILPDGLSNIELLQSCLPIRDVLTCTSVLVGTSLAYQDGKKRLKSLVPIREHMQHFHSPPLSLIQPLQKYFYLLLDLYKKYHGSQHMATNINQIISNFGNLNQIL